MEGQKVGGPGSCQSKLASKTTLYHVCQAVFCCCCRLFCCCCWLASWFGVCLGESLVLLSVLLLYIIMCNILQWVMGKVKGTASMWRTSMSTSETLFSTLTALPSSSQHSPGSLLDTPWYCWILFWLSLSQLTLHRFELILIVGVTCDFCEFQDVWITGAKYVASNLPCVSSTNMFLHLITISQPLPSQSMAENTVLVTDISLSCHSSLLDSPEWEMLCA